MNQLKNNAIFLFLTCTFMTSVGAAPQDGYDRYWIDSNGNFVRDEFGNCIKSINWTAKFDEQNYAPGCDPEPQVAEKDKGAKEIVAAKFEPAPSIETLSLDAHTLFAFNSSKLTDHSKEAIHALTDKLKSFEKVDEIEIAGYADTTGPEGYNQRLSERRAEAIKQKLVSKYGIDPDIITTRGYGESSPVASNATVEGRRLNRRAEIKITAKRKIVE